MSIDDYTSVLHKQLKQKEKMEKEYIELKNSIVKTKEILSSLYKKKLISEIYKLSGCTNIPNVVKAQCVGGPYIDYDDIRYNVPEFEIRFEYIIRDSNNKKYILCIMSDKKLSITETTKTYNQCKELDISDPNHEPALLLWKLLKCDARNYKLLDSNQFPNTGNIFSYSEIYE